MPCNKFPCGSRLLFKKTRIDQWLEWGRIECVYDFYLDAVDGERISKAG